MEEDYTDAREYDDGREVGIGKVYSRDGMVKYEWYIVNSEALKRKLRQENELLRNTNKNILDSLKDLAAEHNMPKVVIEKIESIIE